MAVEDPKHVSDGVGTVQEKTTETLSSVSVRDGDLIDDVSDKRTGMLARLRYYESWLDEKLGVEPHGAAVRMTDDMKRPPKTWVMFFFWSSTGGYSLASISLGMIPWEFGLDLTQAFCVVIFGLLLGCMVSGWCATLGPGTGLRQVAISRYSLGWWPSKIISVLNIVEQIGWAAVGCITGGQALSAVSNYRISVILGILIMNVTTIMVSFGGHQWIQKFNSYFWVAFFIIFLVLYGEAGGKVDVHAPASISGLTFSGTILSNIAIFYGDGASYASIIIDYYVHYPANTSKVKIFLLTTFGIWLPATFGACLGVVVGSATGANPSWVDALDDHGLGGLFLKFAYPMGFAKFLLVLMAFGGLAVIIWLTHVLVGLNVIAIYSSALAIQQFAKPLAKVPRFVWSIVCFACIFALSVGGRDHIYEFLNNFLSLLGYYNTAFVSILAIEHYYFRGGDLANYDLDGWQTPSRLPIGLAGLTSFLLGIAGAVLGMQETYYTGVVAKKIGDLGGDVGNELALVLAVISYFPLRTWERKYFGR